MRESARSKKLTTFFPREMLRSRKLYLRGCFVKY